MFESVSVHIPHIHDPIKDGNFFTWPCSISARMTRTSLQQERETICVTTLQREREIVMPRVQVANKLHEGRARARRAAIVCMPVDRPSTSHTAMGEGSMLYIHLVLYHWELIAE